MKKGIYLLLFSSFALTIPWGVKELTGGFRVEKIRFEVPFRSQWEIPVDAEIIEILRQPFRYLDRGTQSYVFLSQDGKYVIKLFRRSSNLERLFDASKLAFDTLQEETGLIYIHLNHSSVNLPILDCIDALGRHHYLPLDAFSFALQKKGEPLRKTLRAAMGNPSLIKKRINQFVRHLQKRTQMGIVNSDSNLSRNFAFVEDRAIELDFGSFSYSADIDKGKEMERYIKKLRAWLEKNGPEWVSYLDQCWEQSE